MKKLLIGVVAIAVSVLTYAQVDIQWDQNSEADLAGYRLRWSETYGGQPVKVIQVGFSNLVSIPSTNFTFMKTNYFSVTAYNTSGKESLPSTNMVSWIRTNNTPPSMVVNIRIVSATP